MSVRSDLAEILKAGLHKGRYTVIEVPRTLDEKAKRVVQIVRISIKPASSALGSYEEKYAVWVVSPKKDQPEAEDDLETALYDVLGILDGLKWLRWDLASRDVHPSGFEAYRIDFTLYTSRDKGTPTVPFGSGGFGDGTFN